MTQASRHASVTPSSEPASRPFFGLIDSVVLELSGDFTFDGAISLEHASAIWTWVSRDVAPDLIAGLGADTNAKAVEPILPELVARVRKHLAEAAGNHNDERRLISLLRGEEAYRRVPVVLNALKARPLIEQAKLFGRAINQIAEEKAIIAGLQSMPKQDDVTSALMMQALVGQLNNPGRIVAAIIRLTGNSSEAAFVRAGFGPVVEAILAHAQSLVPGIQPRGAYADMDMVCSLIERFHKLVRAVGGYVELARGSRWSAIVAAMTGEVSGRLEPRIRDIVPDVNQSLRKREGVNRIDNEQVLSALSGLYLLVTVRDCRDSLALNAAFDQVWSTTGQIIETHLTRAMESYRDTPGDSVVEARLDAAIKMAELRLGAEYAEVLRKAKDTAARRAS